MVGSELQSAVGRAFWAPQPPPTVRYEVDCRIHEVGEQLHVEGVETIYIRNDSKVPFSLLALTCPGHVPPVRVSVDGRSAELTLGAGDEGQHLVIVKSQQVIGLDRHATFKVEFDYAVPAEAQASLVGWHPRLWWGFETHADFAVRVAAPAGYAIGTSGWLDPDSGAYEGANLRDFGIFLGRNMQALEAEAAGIPIRAICTSAGEPCARLLLNAACDVVRFYREHFGFYPHSSLTIVPGMERPAGGYPLASALVVVHGQERMTEVPEEHWRWITAHEIGHEYWGEHVLVRPPSWWLLIGLGIYTDRQYWCSWGHSLERYRKRLEGYVATAEDGLETRFEIWPEEERQLQFDYNSRIVHDKSYSFVSALECMIGAEALRRALRRCLVGFAGRPMGTREFRSACEAETGLDLAWFFRQWVETDAVLCYRCADRSSEEQEGRYLSSITIRREGQVRMPIPVEVAFEDGTTERAWTERLLDNNVLRFESASPLAEVRIDPDHRLPMLSRVPEAAERSLLRQVSELPWRRSADDAMVLLRRAMELDLRQPDIWARLGMAVFDGGHFEDALSAFKRCGDLAKTESYWSFAAPAWRGHLLDLLGRRDAALNAYRIALERVGDRYVRHDQYGMRVDRAWIEQRIKQPFRDPR